MCYIYIEAALEVRWMDLETPPLPSWVTWGTFLLGLSFFICKMGVMVVPISQGSCEV